MSGAINSFSCPGTIGEVGLRSVKVSVALIQAYPYPKFPGQTGALTLLSKLLAHPPLFQFKHCWDAQLPGVLWSDGDRSHNRWVELWLSSLAWVGWRRVTPGNFQFCKPALQWEGPESYPQPWLSINPPSYAWHRNCPSPELALFWR